MPVLPNFRLNIISVKIPESCLVDRSWQTDSKVYTEKQKILRNQHNIEGQSWKTHVTNYQIYYKAIVIKTRREVNSERRDTKINKTE